MRESRQSGNIKPRTLSMLLCLTCVFSGKREQTRDSGGGKRHGSYKGEKLTAADFEMLLGCPGACEGFARERGLGLILDALFDGLLHG